MRVKYTRQARWKRNIALILSLAFVLQFAMTMPLVARADGGTDKTDWLKNILNLTIKQGSPPVTIGSGDSIDVTQPIQITGKFDTIPLNDDDAEDFLGKGDTAFIPFGENISLALGADTSYTLTHGGTTIGMVTFTTEGGVSGAKFTFEDALWDDSLFTEITDLQFNVALQHDGTGTNTDGSSSDITILGKNFQMYKPVVPIEPTITKSATGPDATGKITWTVIVNAKKGTVADQALKDIKFTDTLTGAHTYVADSVKFTTNTVTNKSITPASDSSLTYTFIEADGNGPATITYETQITDWATVQYGFVKHEFKNSAKAEVNGKTVTDSKTVTIDKKTYIKKTGEKVNKNDPLDRQIYWYIEVNEARHSLTNITVTDQLVDQDFVSAQWQENTASSGEATWVSVGDQITAEQADHKYTYSGTTNKHLRLVITTNSPLSDGDYTTDPGTKKNTATVTWDSKPGGAIGSGEIGVDLGYHALDKSGVFDSNWVQNHHVNWTVKVDLKHIGASSIGNFKVYDLLVHEKKGNEDFSFVDCEAEAGKTFPDAAILNALTPQYGQKYVSTGTVTGGASVTPIKVMKAGVHVADLIEISNFTVAQEATVNFTSKMLDPSAFTQNGTVTAKNTATLFDDETKRTDQTADPDRTVNVLAKSVLKTGEDETGVAGSIGTAGNGFNHVDRTAIFRLSINSSGQKLTDSDFALNGGTETITVTDTLPAGWVFDKDYGGVGTDPGLGYKIFEGDTATVPEPTPVTVQFGESGGLETATFTFNALNKHYVILVKARLTEAAYAALIAGSNTGAVGQTNDASLAGHGVTVNSDATVNVKTGGLSKEGVAFPTDGIAQWKIEYNPLDAKPASDHDDVFIKDQLTQGLEPYLINDLYMDTADLSGSDQTPRFSITELTLEADGTLTEPADAPNLAPAWIAAGKVTYDPVSRELSIELAEPSKAYRVTYLTIVTAKAGTITNNVAVEGMSIHHDSSSGSYVVSESDASAALGLGGYLWVKKVNETGGATITAPATFTISRIDGRVIRSGTTAGGELRFGALAPNTPANPYYLLKEESAPTGFQLDTKTYLVTVERNDDTSFVTTKILDGPTVLVQFGSDGTVVDGNNVAISSKTHNVPNRADSESPLEKYGHLTIGKQIAGSAAAAYLTQDFTITVTFAETPDANGTYLYTGEGGKGDGTLTVSNNAAVITLKHGEKITIWNLPEGAQFTVKEDSASAAGFNVKYYLGTTDKGSNGVSDVVVADGTQKVLVENTKRSSGGTDPEPPKPPEPPVTPPVEPPVEPPVTPPPTTPEPPKYVTPPDPGDGPDEFVLIDEDGTPLGHYHKTKTPDGKEIYVDENGVPLGGWHIPKTGDEAPLVLWSLLLAASLTGAAVLIRPKKRR